MPTREVLRRRQWIAIIVILCVDVLWVSSSELTQTIFHNASYDHAYFLSYFNTSCFTLYALCFLPLFYQTLRRRVRYSNYRSINDVVNQSAPLVAEPVARDPPQQSFSRSSHSCCINSIPSHQLSIWETFKLSCQFCTIWFGMTYAFNLSLNLTSVASNSIISSMSGPATAILSRIFLADYKLTPWNMAGVAVTVIGSCLIGYLDSFKSGGNRDNLVGDIMAVISAMIYSVYTTFIKVKIGDESRVNMFLFFGFIGSLNLVVLWPGILILDASGLESFKMPSNHIWLLLSVNGLLTILSDYFWAQAILLSNPVIATVGLSLMMPLAIVADQLFRGIGHGYLYYIGAVCVWIGFVLVNIDTSKNPKERESPADVQRS